MNEHQARLGHPDAARRRDVNAAAVSPAASVADVAAAAGQVAAGFVLGDGG